MTIRGIARLLGVSTPVVLQWLRKEAPKPIQKPEAGDVEAMQFDEVRHFLGQKNESVGSGLLLILIQSESLTGKSAFAVQLS